MRTLKNQLIPLFSDEQNQSAEIIPDSVPSGRFNLFVFNTITFRWMVIFRQVWFLRRLFSNYSMILGFQMLCTGEKHVNPNRFFAHFFFKEYMQKVPIFLQKLTDPVSSVYFSCALLKIITHLLVIFIISSLISGTKYIFDRKFLISAALITPLIQANGYW
ncbi:MAG: hypothetical protein Q8R96_14175 [Bacteroidota bacterium]|nr:hypothetical protein [Bacteroidota bacterium]